MTTFSRALFIAFIIAYQRDFYDINYCTPAVPFLDESVRMGTGPIFGKQGGKGRLERACFKAMLTAPTYHYLRQTLIQRLTSIFWLVCDCSVCVK